MITRQLAVLAIMTLIGTGIGGIALFYVRLNEDPSTDIQSKGAMQYGNVSQSATHIATSSSPAVSRATFEATPYYNFSIQYDPSSFNEFAFIDNANEEITVLVTPADADYPLSPLIQDLVARGIKIEKTFAVDGVAAYETAPSQTTCSASSTFPAYVYRTDIDVYKSGQLYTISTSDGCNSTDTAELFASYFQFLP